MMVGFEGFGDPRLHLKDLWLFLKFLLRLGGELLVIGIFWLPKIMPNSE